MMRLVIALCVISMSLLIVNVKSNESKQKSSTDTMYVLAYSWTPGFCQGTTYPGCSDPQSFWNTHFTLHGLWPQYTTTGYPSYCSTEEFDDSIPNTIGMSTMTQYWPDVKYAESSSDYDSFWSYEWDKHGTCSGLEQLDYFNDAISLIETFGTPSVLTAAAGTNISATSLRNAFGGSTYVALQCSGTTLTGAYTCWTQQSNVPKTQTVCPTSVQSEDTCKSSDTIIVPVL